MLPNAHRNDDSSAAEGTEDSSGNEIPAGVGDDSIMTDAQVRLVGIVCTEVPKSR